MCRCSLANSCQVNTCNPNTGCGVAPKTAQDIAIMCNDANVCTADICNATTGRCVNVPSVTCPANNQCRNYTCNAVTGVCDVTSRTCDDGQVCTSDSCDAVQGCVYSLIFPPPNGCELTTSTFVTTTGPSTFTAADPQTTTVPITTVAATTVPTTTPVPMTTSVAATTNVPTATPVPTTTSVAATTTAPQTAPVPTTTSVAATTNVPTATPVPTTTSVAATTTAPQTTPVPTTTSVAATTTAPQTTTAPLTTTVAAATTTVQTTIPCSVNTASVDVSFIDIGCDTQVSVSGNAPGAQGVGFWSLVSGGAAILSPNSTITLISNIGGLTVVSWNIQSACRASTFALVTIKRYSGVSPAVVSSPVSIGCAASLFAGAVVPVNGFGRWTLVNGTGSFANSTVANTTITSISSLSSQFLWTVSAPSCLPSSATLIVNTSASNCSCQTFSIGGSSFVNSCDPPVDVGEKDCVLRICLGIFICLHVFAYLLICWFFCHFVFICLFVVLILACSALGW